MEHKDNFILLNSRIAIECLDINGFGTINVQRPICNGYVLAPEEWEAKDAQKFITGHSHDLDIGVLLHHPFENMICCADIKHNKYLFFRRKARKYKKHKRKKWIMKLENLEEANELAKDLQHIQYLIDSVNELDFSTNDIILSDGKAHIYFTKKELTEDVQEDVRSMVLSALFGAKSDLMTRIEKL